MAGESEIPTPDDAGTNGPGTNGPGTNDADIDTSRGTVLVVDDDPVNRRLLARGVEREGHVVRTAEHGGFALDLLRAGGIDLVMLDLLMPEVDGFAVLETMQRDVDLRVIPVLVISAVDDSQSIARAIEMGAVDVLPKPYDPVLLRARLRTALQQARLRRLEQAYLRQEVALRQQEQLAAIGRLSAGLAHEINNPAAAARRAAHQLAERLDEATSVIDEIVTLVDPASVASAVARVPVDEHRAADPLARLDAEDAVVRLLTTWHVPEQRAVAARVTAIGLGHDGLAAAFGDLDPQARTLAIRWALARHEVRRTADHLSLAVQRISEIVGSMRRYSFVDRDRQQLVDVRRGIDDALAVLAHRIPAGVRIERDHPDALPPIVADGGQLNQVWTNLLTNALDAVGESGTITVRTRHDLELPRDAVIVEVVDDGSGVPADVAGTLFDPFVTTKAPGAGTGLGLNISHQIVNEGHGGRIGFTSRPGHTVFSVHLPVAGRVADDEEQQ